MAHYSIKDLERLSGIQAHTIRIWEKRYKLINPERTDTNIRVYSDIDLKRLLNVALLNKNGIKISKISRLSQKELNDKILSLSVNLSDTQNQIETLVLSMVDLNEVNFEHSINKLIEHIGFEKTVTTIIYPFLARVGVLWQTGNINPAQEHFVSGIIRRKLFVAIDQIVPRKLAVKPNFILFLPEGEFHEISLLFYTYLVKLNGGYPIYLGQSVPFTDIVQVHKAYSDASLLTVFTTALPDTSVSEYINKLATTFKKHKIYIAGYQVNMLEFKRGSNIIKLKSLEFFEDLLRKI